MADLLAAISTYQSGTNDTGTLAVNDATLHSAATINGPISAAVQIQAILGVGTSLIGSSADLVARLAVGITGAGVLDVNDATAFPGPLNIARGGTGQATAVLPSGVPMLFNSTTAPTSWTKLTNRDNMALRIVTGTVGDQTGQTGFSTATTNSHTLAISEMPAHTHTAVATVGQITSETGSPQVTHALDDQTNPATSSTGGGGGHTHGLFGGINFIDFIIATKDA